jgi:ACS family tartrate transporter-like MFS transporter
MDQTTPVSPRGAHSVPAVADIEPLERETMHRVMWRLMPLLVLGYFCNYLDRVNVGMAALTMNKQLGFSSAVFGFGSGIFFVGYLLFDLPSNLILSRVGARRWIARILFSWGIVSGFTAFVWNDWSFYGIRFLLGIAEAGFYPGMVLYITWWFPSHYRSRMQAILQSGLAISVIIGPPISGWLLTFNGAFGLQGWQLMFLIEALPAMIMSVVFWIMLTDRPRDAAWLRPEQREWLQRRLDAEDAQREAVHRYRLLETLVNLRVWLLTLVYFAQGMVNFTLMIFLPQIVKSIGISIQLTGFLTAMPFVFGTAAMFYWSARSDRSGNRTLYVATAFLVSATGLVACSLIGPTHPVFMMAVLIIGVMGQMSIAATFWVLPAAMLTGVAAAGGIALINSVGNMGGFVAPYLYGLIKDASGGSDHIALLALAIAPVIAALLLLAMGHDRRLERIPPHA